jgi:putative membrane protein
MWWWNGEWNWAAWIAMLVSMLAFWGIIAWGLVAIARRGDPWGRDRGADPEAILKQRFARGEIDAEEYERCREVLRR